MAEAMVCVRDFRKCYGSLTAVDGISFAVQEGEIFGLLGPNGAGKTSTLECLEGLRAPNGGELRVAGVDPARQAAQLRGVMGVQLQSSGLPANITVSEAMGLFCAYHGTAPRTDLLQRLELGEKLNAQYQGLSAGQQRRLALALAVAHHPRVLFLDEPTAGLDVASRAALHQLMRELRAEGTTIMLASHDMAEVETLADRVAILLKGKIAAEGTPLQITASGAGLSKISVRSEAGCLLRAEPDLAGTAHRVVKDEYAIYYTSNPAAAASQIIAFITAQQDTLVDLRIERPSLEDRFLELTRAGGAW